MSVTSLESLPRRLEQLLPAFTGIHKSLDDAEFDDVLETRSIPATANGEVQSRRPVRATTGSIKNLLQALGLAVDVQVCGRIVVVGITLVVVRESALVLDVEPAIEPDAVGDGAIEQVRNLAGELLRPAL